MSKELKKMSKNVQSVVKSVDLISTTSESFQLSTLTSDSNRILFTSGFTSWYRSREKNWNDGMAHSPETIIERYPSYMDCLRNWLNLENMCNMCEQNICAAQRFSQGSAEIPRSASLTVSAVSKNVCLSYQSPRRRQKALTMCWFSMPTLSNINRLQWFKSCGKFRQGSGSKEEKRSGFSLPLNFARQRLERLPRATT